MLPHACYNCCGRAERGCRVCRGVGTLTLERCIDLINAWHTSAEFLQAKKGVADHHIEQLARTMVRIYDARKK